MSLKSPERTFTIRQLCVEFGCTPRSLRFYEDRGLLNPARNGMNRIYSQRDRARLQLILRGKRVGFSLSEIGELLDLYHQDDTHVTQLARSVTKFRERIAALEAQRVDIDMAIESLRKTLAETEARVGEINPALLERADDYDQVLRARLDCVEASAA